MEMVKRLLWKEAIRSWPLLLAGAVLAVFVFGWVLPRLQHANAGFPPNHYLITNVITVTLGVLMVAVTSWAVMTAGSERFRKSYGSTHFPISPNLAPLIGFIAQLLLGAAIGFGVGAWFLHIDYLLPAAIVLYFAGNAGVSFVVTQAISPAAGIAAGLCWMLGSIRLRDMLASAENARSSAPWSPILQYCVVALPAIMVALAILLLPGRLGRRARQIASCAVLAAVLLGFPIIGPVLSSRSNNAVARFMTAEHARLASFDGALAVAYLDPVRVNGDPPAGMRLELADYPRQWTAQADFTAVVLPVGFIRNDAAILAQQKNGAREITLLRWDRFSDAPRPLFTFTAHRKALWRALRGSPEIFIDGRVDPNGRYGLLVLPTLLSEYGQYDIWLLDFTYGKAKLVVPATFVYQTSIGWSEEQATLTQQNGREYRIDLAREKVSVMQVGKERR